MLNQPKKRKPGRPKMTKGEAKSSIIPIRFSVEDRKRVGETAKEASRSVSDLARDLIAPSISIGDTVSIEGKDGLYVVTAGWPGKPRYFVLPKGKYGGSINWSEWIDPAKMTLVEKAEPVGSFEQFWP